jgi:hypothetical protein
MNWQPIETVPEDLEILDNVHGLKKHVSYL